MKDYRVQKGEEGENYVNDVLVQVLDQMDYPYIVERNSCFAFESVYGKYRYLSAEFDFVVFTPYYVYMIEVKNESYSKCNFSDPLWVLINEENVPNPITQNHTHKQVFCSELKVPLHKVITIEVLLGDYRFKVEKTQFVNDYVFWGSDLYQNFLYLLSSESSDMLNHYSIHKMFMDNIGRKWEDSYEHLERLSRTEIIKKKFVSVLRYIPFHRTDLVKCNCCANGYLHFWDKPFPNKGGKNNVTHYFLGCSTNDRKICKQEHIYLDKDHDPTPFKNLIPISIEERNGWGKELVNRTVLDEINELNRKNEDLRKQLNNMTYLESKLNEKEKTVDDLEIKNSQLEKYNKELIRDLGRYKKIIGPIYKLKKE